MSLTLTLEADFVAAAQKANADYEAARRAVAALPGYYADALKPGVSRRDTHEALEHARIVRDGLARKLIGRLGCGQTLDEIVAEHEASLFRDLSADEAEEFRSHARANYKPGTPIEPIWHPVYRAECARINAAT